MKIGKHFEPGNRVNLGTADIEIGDCVEIGDDVKVIGSGKLRIGDYSKIHRNTFINASGEVTLGQLAWIGERSVLDGTGVLRAGDFLGVGIGSSLYSHIRHGDISYGSQYDSKSELLIGHDVWFVGQCLVNPIVALDKSMAMLGSVVTKDMEMNHVYAGVPAKDITDRTGPGWSSPTMDRVFHTVTHFVDEGCELLGLKRSQFQVCKFGIPSVRNPEITYYSIEYRTYTKRLTEDEIKLNRFLFSSRAKFRAI